MFYRVMRRKTLTITPDLHIGSGLHALKHSEHIQRARPCITTSHSGMRGLQFEIRDALGAFSTEGIDDGSELPCSDLMKRPVTATFWDNEKRRCQA